MSIVFVSMRDLILDRVQSLTVSSNIQSRWSNTPESAWKPGDPIQITFGKSRTEGTVLAYPHFFHSPMTDDPSKMDEVVPPRALTWTRCRDPVGTEDRGTLWEIGTTEGKRPELNALDSLACDTIRNMAEWRMRQVRLQGESEKEHPDALTSGSGEELVGKSRDAMCI